MINSFLRSCRCRPLHVIAIGVLVFTMVTEDTSIAVRQVYHRASSTEEVIY